MREATSVIGERATGVTINEDNIVLHLGSVSLRFYPTNEETVEAERVRDVREKTVKQ
jgi:hypothetical protein